LLGKELTACSFHITYTQALAIEVLIKVYTFSCSKWQTTARLSRKPTSTIWVGIIINLSNIIIVFVETIGGKIVFIPEIHDFLEPCDHGFISILIVPTDLHI
jgi:hypothetical protein